MVATAPTERARSAGPHAAAACRAIPPVPGILMFAQSGSYFLPQSLSRSTCASLGVALAVIGLIGPVATASTPPLPTAPTVTDYVRAALAADPSLRVATATAEAASWQAEAADRRPDPEFSFMFENISTRTGPAMIVARLSQQLPWPGTLAARAAAASAEARMLVAEEAARAVEAASSAAQLALELAYLDAAADRARQSAQLLDSLRPLLGERVRGGADAADLLRLEVEIGLAFDAARTLERAADRRSAALATLIGRPPGSRLPAPPLPDELPTMPDPAVLAARWERANPELLAALEGVAAAQAGLEFTRRENRPMLGFGVSWDESRERNPAMRRPSPVGVEVMMSIPLQRDRRRAAEHAAAARIRRAEASLDARRRALTEATAVAATDLREAADRARLHEFELLPAARGSLELAVAGYRTGLGTITDLVERHRVVLALETTLARSKAEAHQAAVRLAALAGNPPTALAEGNRDVSHGATKALRDSDRP